MKAPDYECRNLRLAVVDDDLQKNLNGQPFLVDQVMFHDNTDRLSRLEDHCRAAAGYRPVAFDLLSVDMNFQDDLNDPMRPNPRPGELGTAALSMMTASGLYHGLALLARREQHDPVGNRLPLAWEVRSVTPGLFSLREELHRDALRGYALLRSFLARPLDGEPLELCIVRESGNAGQTASLMDAFRQDLASQSPSSGYIPEMLKKLLPRWRQAFLEGVRGNEIFIESNALDMQRKALHQLIELHGSAAHIEVSPPHSPLCLPLRGNAGAGTAYGIRLSSVFADCIVGPGIPVSLRMPIVPDQPTISVVDWMNLLIDAADSCISEWKRRFLEIRTKFESVIKKKGSEGVYPLWNSEKSRDIRTMLYILMRVRTLLLDGENPGDVDSRKFETSMANRFGFSNAHENTFYRPLTGNRIFEMRPSNFRLVLREAVRFGTGDLAASASWCGWLRECLRDYVLGMGYDADSLDKEARGLAG